MENNNITFSEAMYDPEAPDRKIVMKECFIQFDAWKDMGFNIRTICEAQLLAALEGIGELEDPREWRHFWRFAQEQAKKYDNRFLHLLEEKAAAMESDDSE